MKSLKTAALAAAFAVTGGIASASTIDYANSVVAVNQGSCNDVTAIIGGSNLDNGLINTDCQVSRSVAANALGAPDGQFYALGFDGDITLGFENSPYEQGLAAVFEVTTRRDIGHDEAATVYALLGGAVVFSIDITNAVGTNVFQILTEFDEIKIVDTTLSVFGAATTSFDGFDIESIGISPIPLPAAGVLLLAAIGGLGVASRRKKA